RASSPQTSSSRSRSRSSTPSGNRLAAMSDADLTRHAVHVLPEGELERKMTLGRPLRVKLGIDPTAPDIHLGFAYVLDRLAEFQREGHTVVLIVGDYTARIGDPSGRSDERPVLPDEVLDANAKEFAEQAFRVLDRERTEIRFNGEWLRQRSPAGGVRLSRPLTPPPVLGCLSPRPPPPLSRDRGGRRSPTAVRRAGADLDLRAALSAHAGVRLR